MFADFAVGLASLVVRVGLPTEPALAFLLQKGSSFPRALREPIAVRASRINGRTS
jgi:hypothetical protein